jgi:ribonucleoside-diphosphate reductase alpha chain
MIGIAYNLAKNNFRIGDDKAFHYVHWLAERHAYYVIEASLRLGKEKDNAPYIDRTKWKDGWTPLASYNRNVDSITDKPFKHMYDWEKLSEAIKANGGIRNSTLIAMQPTESSSKATGYPNGVYPIRDIYLLKTDLNNSIDWIARDSDELAEQYHKAWDISTEDLIKYYSIIQKFCDQAISADFYINRIRYQTYKVSQLLEELYYMYKYGLKTRYYTNSLTLKGEVLDSVDKECAGGSCTL